MLLIKESGTNFYHYALKG